MRGQEVRSQELRSQELQIAIVGTGSIGSAFGFQLAHVGGHRVTAVARPGSLRWQQLKRDGVLVNTAGERAAVQVTDTLDAAVPYDLVLVTLLAHQVGAVMPALQRSAAKTVLFMFNNFEPERLRNALGVERCCFGMPFIQAKLEPTGKFAAQIGTAGQKSKIGDQRWVDVFNRAGLPATLEPKMLLWLRCHVPLGAAFESVCVKGMRRGGGALWRDSVVVARGARESWTMIKRLGYPLYPGGKVLLHASPTWLLAGLLWFVSRIRSFRELLATGANECQALVDSLAAGAALARPPVSAEFIVAMSPQSE